MEDAALVIKKVHDPVGISVDADAPLTPGRLQTPGGLLLNLDKVGAAILVQDVAVRSARVEDLHFEAVTEVR